MWVYFRHSFLIADESNQSISYAANFASCFLGFVFARLSTSARASLLLTFEVVDGTDKDFDTADIDDGEYIDKNSINKQEDTAKGVNFGSCFLGFIFVRWSTSSRTSLLLTFKIVDGRDEDFDTANIDDGNNADKNSVDKREDTVEGVEHNGGDSTSKEPTRGDTICFFSVVFNTDLPTIAFLRGGL